MFHDDLATGVVALRAEIVFVVGVANPRKEGRVLGLLVDGDVAVLDVPHRRGAVADSQEGRGGSNGSPHVPADEVMGVLDSINLHHFKERIDLPPRPRKVEVFRSQLLVEGRIQLRGPLDTFLVIPPRVNLPGFVPALRMRTVVLSYRFFKEMQGEVRGLDVFDVPSTFVATLPLVVETQGGHIRPIPDLHDYIGAFLKSVVSNPPHVLVRDIGFRLDIWDDHVDPTQPTELRRLRVVPRYPRLQPAHQGSIDPVLKGLPLDVRCSRTRRVVAVVLLENV